MRFLDGRLTCDPARMSASLEGGRGNPVYGTGQPRADRDSFIFLIGCPRRPRRPRRLGSTG
jgi:hypothetical protein